MNSEPVLLLPPTVTTTLPVVAPLGTGTTIDVALQLLGVALVPLKLTVLVPCVAPKFEPLIVTDVPIKPEDGDNPLIAGGWITVNSDPLLLLPPTVTTTLPVVAPLGMGTTIDVALQLLGVALVPLKLTVLVPCVAPKFEPLIVTDVPIKPEDGDNPLIAGGWITVNSDPLLLLSPTVTTTLPVVAPLGMGTTIELALQLLGVAMVPLKLTVLVPCVAPKFEPLIVTDVPTTPEDGDNPLIAGGWITVNSDPLLLLPPTVTTTLPVVAPLGTGTTIELALQLLGVALVPLNLTVFVPWLAPKFDPLIVTDVPTTPEDGDKPLIAGGWITVNSDPLLLLTPTVTTTLPVVAPLGTGTTIELALQLLGVALVPLNLTVLVPWLAPKFDPLIVTDVLTTPEDGDKPLIAGGWITVNSDPLLLCPLTVTTTLPVVAPLGTGSMIELALQLLGVALVPLNLTVLVPCVAPKFEPLIVTDVLTTPEVGDNFVIEGDAAAAGSVNTFVQQISKRRDSNVLGLNR